jgi:tRNA threonylcarbamoyladenosine biosynthesis protein TsaB
VNYLALDASTEACSVALQFNDEVFSRYEVCPQSHSLRLLPMIDDVLKVAGCKLSQLEGLIFGQGPGSFTGVRIGIGVAQGLAFSANLKLVGVSTLQTMAQLAYINHQETDVIAVIDARMSEVYNGYYELDEHNIMQPKINEAVTAPSEVKQRLLSVVEKAYGVGTGWDAYKADLTSLKSNNDSPKVLFPEAKAMLAIGIAAFNRGESVLPENAQPVYVRDTVSWKKLPGRK